ncbi:MAG: nuclear transport factor 2 family protein [Gammaproteobacteria bacterium]|nr:nuclear transport factor 2 family protein [Gammaproteobacteria bacterium]MBU1553550.1 nuclear transport factor 2 family protein [Gammaproteobacteria bacterium]MBU2069106.1 nuclear transport factor 2 family protein [Gammaproteobacteria bacterium]MBU2182639.1 nuclear transport factor 2 family protein [Gammaproteobacteria bacterium]MBU2206566.1 nuclear transport factor 2 family protein [Gammaproteobacteria bacterium]
MAAIAYQAELAAISTLLGHYFDGLHRADTALLSSIFDDAAQLYAPGVRRSKQQWLDLVANRPVPAALGHAFAYQILSIEQTGEQALAKVACPLLGRHFIDYLSLLKEQGQWRIVAKLYADNPFINTD